MRNLQNGKLCTAVYRDIERGAIEKPLQDDGVFLTTWNVCFWKSGQGTIILILQPHRHQLPDYLEAHIAVRIMLLLFLATLHQKVSHLSSFTVIISSMYKEHLES